MTKEFERGFASTSRTKRKWAAVKAVFKADKINQFQDTIERTKSTLMLANQQHMAMMVAAGFEDLRLWRNTMTSLVNHSLRQKSALDSRSSALHQTPHSISCQRQQQNSGFRNGRVVSRSRLHTTSQDKSIQWPIQRWEVIYLVQGCHWSLLSYYRTIFFETERVF